jgi:hypothetical protein
MALGHKWELFAVREREQGKEQMEKKKTCSPRGETGIAVTTLQQEDGTGTFAKPHSKTQLWT